MWRAFFVVLFALCVTGHFLEIKEPLCGTVARAGSNVTVVWESEEIEEPLIKLVLRRGPAPDRIVKDISSTLYPDDFFLVDNLSSTSNMRQSDDGDVDYRTSVTIPSLASPGLYHVVTIFITEAGTVGHVRTSRDFLVVSTAQGSYIARNFIAIAAPVAGQILTFGAPFTVKWSTTNFTTNVNIRVKDQVLSGVPNTGAFTLPGTFTDQLAKWKNNDKTGLVEASSNFFVYVESTYNTDLIGISGCFEMETSFLDVDVPTACYVGTSCSVRWSSPYPAIIQSYSANAVSTDGATIVPISSNIPPAATGLSFSPPSSGSWVIKVEAQLTGWYPVQGNNRSMAYGISSELPVLTAPNGVEASSTANLSLVLSSIAITLAGLLLLSLTVIILLLPCRERRLAVDTTTTVKTQKSLTETV
mmetsp:Transcript_29964/g.50308  ORF Transcript_29964/g.50308 Transcript_29964/m.50308 type:complete len:416 (+) Transcript_29964:172-1419(+)